MRLQVWDSETLNSDFQVLRCEDLIGPIRVQDPPQVHPAATCGSTGVIWGAYLFVPGHSQARGSHKPDAGVAFEERVEKGSEE